MRRVREVMALVGLATAWGIPTYAISHGLKERIPVHFDWAGQADRWGSRSELWALPAIAFGVYFLLTIVPRFSGAFNYPVPVTKENHARLRTRALEMIGWLKAELMLLMAFLVFFEVESAQLGTTGNLPPYLFAGVGIVLITVGAFWRAMFRDAKPGSATISGAHPTSRTKN